jgi:hypothetical protein
LRVIRFGQASSRLGKLLGTPKTSLSPSPSESYDFSRDTVFFTGLDGAKKVQCAISEEALADHFERGAQPLVAFRAHREAIESLARRKYLSGQVDPDGHVLLRTADFRLS